jgi:N-acyl homoserine lactone hydrolase
MTLALLATLLAAPQPATPPPDIKLYAMDCGHIAFPNMGFFSDTGDYDGKPGQVIAPCFLIRHPKGDFLFESGLGDAMLDKPLTMPYAAFSVTTTLLSQLQQLGMTYDDIEIFGFSHAHSDHIGNAPNLTKATWLIPAAELTWMMTAPGQHPELLEARNKVKTVDASGDYDVFGDGSVRMLQTPGHTPGHHALFVKLAKGGNVILSGDLVHLRESYDNARVPPLNVSRAETLASIDRIKKLQKNTKAKLIIEHDQRDFDALPKFPKYLE